MFTAFPIHQLLLVAASKQLESTSIMAYATHSAPRPPGFYRTLNVSSTTEMLRTMVVHAFPPRYDESNDFAVKRLIICMVNSYSLMQAHNIA